MAVGVNLATGRPAPAIIVGTTVLVVCFAALEAWRARSPQAADSGVKVRQSADHVNGKMIGYRGGPTSGSVDIHQDVKRAGSGSEIIGYDGNVTA
ncbi:hypothetical protein ACFWNN_00040 [Lentzea sp. NPDC058450]|uniref:hypothetical protein n=1 Tax=Lentzea sp. NPDC058450 TaxID=3346505 RepID=UPI003649175C